MKKVTGEGTKKVAVIDSPREEYIEEMQKLRSKEAAESDLTMVTYGETRTVNIGNYESVKVLVSVSTPVLHKAVPKALGILKTFVSEEVMKKVVDIRAGL